MPAKTGKLFVGVGHRHLVTMCKVLLMVEFNQAGRSTMTPDSAQYSAVECTRARVVTWSVLASAPQPEPASCFKSVT